MVPTRCAGCASVAGPTRSAGRLLHAGRTATSLHIRAHWSAPMQRWLKLPDGRYIDANSIVYVGKVETYPRLDDDGNDAGQGYSVPLGTDVMRDHHLTVMGTKEEVL